MDERRMDEQRYRRMQEYEYRLAQHAIDEALRQRDMEEHEWLLGMLRKAEESLHGSMDWMDQHIPSRRMNRIRLLMTT